LERPAPFLESYIGLDFFRLAGEHWSKRKGAAGVWVDQGADFLKEDSRLLILLSYVLNHSYRSADSFHNCAIISAHRPRLSVSIENSHETPALSKKAIGLKMSSNGHQPTWGYDDDRRLVSPTSEPVKGKPPHFSSV